MVQYSYSRLSTFDSCPRQYKYKYVDGLERSFETIELFMGKRVHEALEWLYTNMQFCKETSREELLDYYRQEWERNWHEDIKIVKDYQPQHYKKVGERCLRDYYNSYKPFDYGKNLGLEVQVNLELEATGERETYELIGYIDRLTKVGERYEVHDYKTSRRLPTTDQLRDNLQLALYALGVKRNYKNIDQIKLVWHYLAHDEEIRLACPQEKMERVKEEVKSKIEQVERAEEKEEFPPQESGLCAYCAFQEVCPLFKHKYETEDLEPKEYKQEEGVQLVNKFRNLREKKKRAEKELKQVKRELVKYAQQQGVENVYGSDVKARVKTYHNSYFPGKDDPQREELVNILQEAGKLEAVSSLNLRKLASKFDKNEFDPDLIKQLEQLAEEKDKQRIYLSEKE